VLACAGKKYTVEEAKAGVFGDLDVAFFATDGAITRALAPDAVKAGCLVIDRARRSAWTPMCRWSFRRIIPRACGGTRASLRTRTARRPSRSWGFWPLPRRLA